MIDDNNDDLDAPEDFEKEHIDKPSLKEIWDNNPPLKIVAIVLVLVIGLGAYILFSSEEPATSKIKVNATATQTPGEKDVDPVYRKALEEANKRDAEAKEHAGLSHVDIPVNIPNSGGLQVPKMPEHPASDVLEEWKRVADQGRMKAAKEAVDEENQAPPPEVVPMVQPIRPQEIKPDPAMAKNMASLMKQLMEYWGPQPTQTKVITKEDSLYEVMKKNKEEGAKLAGNNSAGGAGASAAGGAANAASADRIIVPAGNIAYAQLLTTLNSDLPGPVLAQVLSGPFTGGRLIGKLKADQDCECLIIEFKTVVKDTVSYKINAIAMDENTTLTGVDATDVDHHYMERYVLPAAASFLTGYSQALSQTGQNSTLVQGAGAATSTPAPSPKQSIFAGLTTSSQSIGNDLNKNAGRSPTIVVAQGTTMGVFFTDPVTTGDAGK